jgi:hypothetical protein
MAKCELCNDGHVMTAHGKKIHMGKIHGVHYGYVGEREGSPDLVLTLGVANILPQEEAPVVPQHLVPCGHPFCAAVLPRAELRAHWGSDHPTWLMHDGRYVFEV